MNSRMRHRASQQQTHGEQPQAQESVAQERPPEHPELEVSALKAELEEVRESYMRALADLQNFRRRTQAEREDLRRFATESLVRELLPVLDNFERTLSAAREGASAEALLAGVEAVDRQLRSALEAVQVKRIESVGQPFDPEHHEALAAEHTEDHPAETVLAEIEPGYKMAGKVIRPARVRVAKSP